jgi:hypothetical protein
VVLVHLFLSRNATRLKRRFGPQPLPSAKWRA